LQALELDGIDDGIHELEVYICRVAQMGQVIIILNFMECGLIHFTSCPQELIIDGDQIIIMDHLFVVLKTNFILLLKTLPMKTSLFITIIIFLTL
jgi:hypothetical protein